MSDPKRGDVKNERYRSRYHLVQNKGINVLVTNACNLTCGGCHQQCGQFSKDKLFFMELGDLKWVIDWIRVHTTRNRIGIFGGEPTLHPKYQEILSLLRTYKHKMNFVVYTNGRLGHQAEESNIRFRVSSKQDPKRKFEPTLVAAIDVIGKRDKASYWELAKQHCHMWKNCCCVIMGRRAYACEVFAAIDTLIGEDHGWELKWGENAFDHSEQEIREQAVHFCYRCGWCLPPALKQQYDQRIGEQTLVTISNLDLPLKRPVQQVTAGS